MNGSIRRRGKNSWELTIDLGRNSQGKRLRKYVTVKGRKVEAERKLRELLSLTDKGIPINTQRLTLAQWLERWLRDYVAPRLRPKSIERYEEIVRKYLVPHLGQVELTRVTPADIQALEAKLLDQGMAPAGVDLVHNVLSGAFKYALRMEVAWRNPVQAVTPPKVARREVMPPEIEAVRRILELARAENPLFHTCFHLIAYTGLRRGEALGLRWQDTDLKAGTISIVQTLTRSHRQGLIFQPPKTDRGRRTIDLDSDTIEVLRAHQGQQLLSKCQAEEAYVDNDLVFADPLGAPLDPMALTRNFQTLARRVGINNIRLHDLRHFHASVMLQTVPNPALVSKRLGHASTSATLDIYAHVLPGWQKEAANAFARALQQR
jgi:integrase